MFILQSCRNSKTEVQLYFESVFWSSNDSKKLLNFTGIKFKNMQVRK